MADRFNPRPRVGGDIDEVSAEVESLVSIRAPAWGAISKQGKGGIVPRGFNPRPRVGGDLTILTPSPSP